MLKLFAFSRYRFDSEKKVLSLLDRLQRGPFPITKFDEAEPIKRKLDFSKRSDATKLLIGPEGDGGTLFLSSKKPRSTFVFRWMPNETSEWYGEFEEGILDRAGGREAVISYFAGIFREFPVVFAGLASEEEWDAKHWIVEEDDEGGELVTKVGLNLEACLPGIYWMTVLGADLVAHFGRDALFAAPLHEVIDLGGAGVALILEADPCGPYRQHRAAQEESVVRALGPEYFFDISQPLRKCVGILKVSSPEGGSSPGR